MIQDNRVQSEKLHNLVDKFSSRTGRREDGLKLVE